MVPSNFTPSEIIKIIKTIPRDELEDLFIKYAELCEQYEEEGHEADEDMAEELDSVQEQLECHRDCIKDIIDVCNNYPQENKCLHLIETIIQIYYESGIE